MKSKVRILLLMLAAVVHLLPLPFGVSPVGATALYAGAHGPRRIFWLMPLSLLLIGNLVFGFYEPLVMAFVYVGFALSAVIARWLLDACRSRARLCFALLIGAVTFFFVSNFSVWLAGMYPPTAAGLFACYLNGLPYLGQAVLIDGVFAFALFSAHDSMTRRSANAGADALAA